VREIETTSKVAKKIKKSPSELKLALELPPPPYLLHKTVNDLGMYLCNYVSN
jgi:hypothetical protein